MSDITVRLVERADAAAFARIAPEVFDNDIDPAMLREFLDDPRHHLAVAFADGEIVGMASAVHYVHPDKRAQLFINEVGVTPAQQQKGIGRRLVDCLLELGRKLDCTEAWVLTEPDNLAARSLYARTGGIEEPTPVVMFTFPLNEEA